MLYSGESITISGNCLPQTSINKAPYKVELNISKDRTLFGGHCNCVSGIVGKCKHTSALAHFINSERTEGCTDTAQQWQKPSAHRQSLYPKGETIEALFNTNPISHPTFKDNSEKINNFLALMASEKVTDGMLYKSLTAPTDFLQAQVKSVDVDTQVLDTIFSENKAVICSRVPFTTGTKTVFKKLSSTLTDETEMFYSRNIEKNLSLCKETFANTLGQNKNPNWFLERKLRISASKAHRIMKAKKKETLLKYFFELQVQTKGMAYGNAMETIARECYTNITGNLVKESGLIIKPGQTWLCASPDGLISQGKICLEIKCPSSCENSQINVNYITNNQLVKNHMYYTQVQIQLYVSNCDLCHFFVFSEADNKLIVVHRDNDYL